MTDPGHTPSPSAQSHDGDGFLAPLLLILTVVTGLVDAISYLALGHVFVANMTGNVVFLAFALAGTANLSALASIVAFAAFLGGALVGGRLGSRLATHRGRLLACATTTQTVLLTIAVSSTAMMHGHVTTAVQYTLIVSLGLALGLQNAVARRLGVPDLTTTVLTLTLTGLAADSALAGGTGPRRVRRILSVLMMFLGALAGSRLVLHGRLLLALCLILLLLAMVSVTAWHRSGLIRTRRNA